VSSREMTAVGDVVSGWPCAAWFAGCRESRKLVLIIVAIALLLDNMLLTTVGELIVLNTPSTILYNQFSVFINSPVYEAICLPVCLQSQFPSVSHFTWDGSG